MDVLILLVPKLLLASSETACPQYYLAFDLTRTGCNTGIDFTKRWKFNISTQAAEAATELDYIDCWLIHSAVCVVEDQKNLTVQY
jgi:hypothetical protein